MGADGSPQRRIPGRLALWDGGSIKPRIDRVYPFTEVAAAHQRILQRQNIGKIVLTP
jgi:NADPH:quinone reductase-like Zn-dependent oxidoreductase